MHRPTPPAPAGTTSRLLLRLTLGALVVAAWAAALSSVSAQQAPELPAAVQEWLDRDQFRQWAGLVRTGQELFAEGSCARCHGEAGTAGRNGPDLTDAEWVQSDGSLEGIRETIFWGVRWPPMSGRSATTAGCRSAEGRSGACRSPLSCRPARPDRTPREPQRSVVNTCRDTGRPTCATSLRGEPVACVPDEGTWLHFYRHERK